LKATSWSGSIRVAVVVSPATGLNGCASVPADDRRQRQKHEQNSR
jgi:hypothetical protein